jgi:hypothetical protein
MSIPIDKRDLGDGWVLTCHGKDGGDLTLSDVNIKRENLVCQIMGGDSLFFPMFADDDADSVAGASSDAMPSSNDAPNGHIEESILDNIRELLLNAQKHGCWKTGVGGVGKVSGKLLNREFPSSWKQTSDTRTALPLRVASNRSLCCIIFAWFACFHSLKLCD